MSSMPDVINTTPVADAVVATTTTTDSDDDERQDKLNDVEKETEEEDDDDDDIATTTPLSWTSAGGTSITSSISPDTTATTPLFQQQQQHVDVKKATLPSSSSSSPSSLQFPQPLKDSATTQKDQAAAAQNDAVIASTTTTTRSNANPHPQDFLLMPTKNGVEKIVQQQQQQQHQKDEKKQESNEVQLSLSNNKNDGLDFSKTVESTNALATKEENHHNNKKKKEDEEDFPVMMEDEQETEEHSRKASFLPDLSMNDNINDEDNLNDDDDYDDDDIGETYPLLTSSSKKSSKGVLSAGGTSPIFKEQQAPPTKEEHGVVEEKSKELELVTSNKKKDSSPTKSSFLPDAAGDVEDFTDQVPKKKKKTSTTTTTPCNNQYSYLPDPTGDHTISPSSSFETDHHNNKSISSPTTTPFWSLQEEGRPSTTDVALPVSKQNNNNNSTTTTSSSSSGSSMTKEQREILLRNLQQFYHERKPSTIAEGMPEEMDKPRSLANVYSCDSLMSALSTRPSIDNLQQLVDSSMDEVQQQPSSSSPPFSPARRSFGKPLQKTGSSSLSAQMKGTFEPLYTSTKFCAHIARRFLQQHYVPFSAATWIGFFGLLNVTCANYVLTPMRDAIALQVGVEHVPKLTLASTLLAFCSSVPIGWLFEAPDPSRRRFWRRMGLTRGETQGTSLALFYRCFAFVLLSYAVGFQFIEYLIGDVHGGDDGLNNNATVVETTANEETAVFLENQVREWWPSQWWLPASLWTFVGKSLYVAFFLVVHLMKLHSLSLLWGVTTEAMEYEETARKRSHAESRKTRLQRMGLVGFGGTLGGIVGSGLASSLAQILRLPGLLVLAAILLEVSAELSIELGRIMQKYWEEQQLFQSSNDLASLDSSMKRSASLGSMKRVSSGNSLNRVRSADNLQSGSSNRSSSPEEPVVNDDSFVQRLLRGVTTILRSRLLMSIFTYNALYASTTVLLSFQRAALVANRNSSASVQADTAFLANINMASSVAIFMLQASGAGTSLASYAGPRGTLALMPIIRLAGVLSLAWWHRVSNGKPPNLLVFLMVDECCKIMNLAVAKPVRESLWRGLSNEARYEAKPIVDTLANRWGGGSAAFLVSFINRTLDLFGVAPEGPDDVRTVFGFPPIIALCLIIATWWVAVSADLGQIRKNIDMELKKRQ